MAAEDPISKADPAELPGGARETGPAPTTRCGFVAILGSPIPKGVTAPVTVEVESADPQRDGERLLRTFMSRRFRLRPLKSQPRQAGRSRSRLASAAAGP